MSALGKRIVAAVEIADRTVDLHADRVTRIVGLSMRMLAGHQQGERESEADAVHLSAAERSPASARADDSDTRMGRRLSDEIRVGDAGEGAAGRARLTLSVGVEPAIAETRLFISGEADRVRVCLQSMRVQM